MREAERVEVIEKDVRVLVDFMVDCWNIWDIYADTIHAERQWREVI